MATRRKRVQEASIVLAVPSTTTTTVGHGTNRQVADQEPESEKVVACERVAAAAAAKVIIAQYELASLLHGLHG